MRRRSAAGHGKEPPGGASGWEADDHQGHDPGEVAKVGVCDFGPSAILVRFWSAAAWAAGLPPGEARAWAAANVVGQWRLFNESAAQAWIKTLPPDERAIAVKAMPELQTAP